MKKFCSAPFGCLETKNHQLGGGIKAYSNKKSSNNKIEQVRQPRYNQRRLVDPFTGEKNK